MLLDVLTDDPTWADWSECAIADARDAGDLVINPIVYAEVSAGFDTIEEVDDALPPEDFTRSRCLTRQGFSPRAHTSAIDDAVATVDHHCQTSTSVHMLLYRRIACSPVTKTATAATFRNCR